jgi:hypothetical protein
LSAEGARGMLPPTSRFSRFPLRGDLGKSEPVREHRQCLLFLSIILDKNSYPDFFGIMTFYQECCICAISSKKGRDNMGDFSSIYKFF